MMRRGPSAKAIAKWEAESGESLEAKVATVSTIALDLLKVNKVVASTEAVPQVFSQHIKRCIVNFVAYQTLRDYSAVKEKFSAAAKKLADAKALIDSIGQYEIEMYSLVAKRRRRPNINIFSKSILLSMDDAISDFKRRARTRPGPKERFDLEIPVLCAIDAFEAAAGREFKRNFRIQGSMKSQQSDFVTIDAIFVETVLKAFAPGLTKSNVKTALLKLPPRRSGDRVG
ncbi:hypothetical protein ELH75_01290 [Rhizobium leguminosarum]|uniref:hypothetical protein n=1 Tax=Rhizobium leguminosarum TaxID=384 RepID=UPI0010318F65|nr:hypothetical protein [Rhizobium leguminosarum]TAX99819.1 hypothetical protein ELH95_01075 [Rhizobium leguminosarum]TAZ59964.1 hypothetical protein ELH75_01290 [Rhizobium leguminosarum]